MNTGVHQCLILGTQLLISLDDESCNEINENDYYGLQTTGYSHVIWTKILHFNFSSNEIEERV